jgi:hypothetical protein
MAWTAWTARGAALQHGCGHRPSGRARQGRGTGCRGGWYVDDPSVPVDHGRRGICPSTSRPRPSTARPALGRVVLHNGTMFSTNIRPLSTWHGSFGPFRRPIWPWHTGDEKGAAHRHPPSSSRPRRFLVPTDSRLAAATAHDPRAAATQSLPAAQRLVGVDELAHRRDLPAQLVVDRHLAVDLVARVQHRRVVPAAELRADPQE